MRGKAFPSKAYTLARTCDTINAGSADIGSTILPTPVAFWTLKQAPKAVFGADIGSSELRPFVESNTTACIHVHAAHKATVVSAIIS
jgi:hypothetical protein